MLKTPGLSGSKSPLWRWQLRSVVRRSWWRLENLLVDTCDEGIRMRESCSSRLFSAGTPGLKVMMDVEGIFEEPLTPTDLSSIEEAEVEDSVSKAVKKQ